jgi:uncharacterized protein DUF1549/uncharacterized protein DUF1553
MLQLKGSKAMPTRFAIPAAVRGWRLGVLLFSHLLAGLIPVAGSMTACAADAIPTPSATHELQTGEVRNESEDPAAGLTAEIDRQVATRWAEEQLEPAPAADDAEFLRRTFLNIAGRIPSCSEVQSFLEDMQPKKRRRMVERLLESPAYPTHFAEVLRSAIVPEVSIDPQLQFQGAAAFEQWIRRRIAENAGYDRIARDMLTAPVGAQGPGFYFVAKGGKPENVAAGAARVFLGVRIECAQCHNHPFAKWRREQFWQFAAFFAGIDRQPNGRIGDELRPAELKIPGLGKVVQARFLDDEQSTWDPDGRPREALANWITAPQNSYFARAAVNRIWAHFLGTGIVDPIDDFDESNPPSHPQLLDALATDFTRQKCDLKFLIRAICSSRPYQLSSVQTNSRQADRRFFARGTIKGLTAAELAASLGQAVGEFDGAEGSQFDRPGYGPNPSPLRAMVAELFRNDNAEPVDIEATILQALALMNSAAIDQSTAPGRGSTLSAVLESPFLDTVGRIETLYLATLSRRPTPQESARLVKYVESGGTHSASKPKMKNVLQQIITTDRVNTRGDKDVALGDVFWALLNSSEFLTNH